MSLMTPLNRVLGLGTGKGAGEHWWLQRMTAVALLPLGLWLAYELLTLRSFDYASVAAWVGEPITSILLILLVISAHGLVWRFMTSEPVEGRRNAMSPQE